MKCFIWAVLAASLTISVACKKQSSDGAGSGAAPPAAAGSAATGSAVTGSAATGSAAAGGPAAGSAGSDSAAAGGAATGGSAAPAGAAAGGPATGSDTGSAAMAAGGSAASELMAHRAGMCPSTVLGAKTTEAVKGKAVVVTIESADKDAIAAIQKRTDKLLAEKKAGPASGTVHDQKGAYGGSKGLCPVYVAEGAHATAKHEAKGVVVTITPKGKPDELAQEIDARIARASDWVKANLKDGDKGNQGGVGGGMGDDGSNHSGKGDGKGQERKKGGGGKGTGGGGGKGTGGGDKSG
jgi:hypothetical protein